MRAVRTTVHPDPPATTVDVEVAPGTSAGEVRRRLALLTGDPGWAGPAARLHVDDVALDDTHPAGAEPFLPGARLSRRPGAPHPAQAAVRADAHVAVVAGPGAGTLVAVPQAGPLLLGAGAAGPRATDGTAGPDGTDGIDGIDGIDGTVEVRTVRLRTQVRAAHAGTGHGRTAVHLARPVRRPTRGPAAGRRRTRRLRPGRWSRWRTGEALHVGRSVLVLRTPADLLHPPPARPRRRLPVWAWSGLATTATSVALAVALRQPVLLVGAALGLVALLAGRAPDGSGPRADGDRHSPADVAARHALTLLGATARPSDGDGAARSDRPGPGRGRRAATDPGGTPDGDVALVGTRADVLGAARALVLHRLGTAPATRLAVLTHDPASWAWSRWWAPATGLPSPDARGPHLVVVDGHAAGLGRWRAARPPGQTVLVVGAQQPPAWVRTVVTVTGAARPRPARRRRRAARGLRASTPRPGHRPGAAAPVELVPADVADRYARDHVAHLARTGVGPGTPGPAAADPAGPAHVATLGDLDGVPVADPAAVAAAWARTPDRLRLALGTGPAGTTTVLDLDADGPHLLVAGTTGAGKSELLTTLVLAAALSRPPDRLALLLVDFKGGTGLGPVASLPHVVGHVDDLDAARARRALVGLRAELRRRERVLAAHGATHLRDLDPAAVGTPPRLLVVVDELRALLDDVPDASAVLARIAAQGRALGVHLVLATQRPAGTVTAELRANVTARLCLRVADPADSRDVLEVPDAAAIDPRRPGRALLRTGPGAPVPLQVARARRRTSARTVRLATPWHPAVTPPWRPGAPAGPDDVAAWVAAARSAAGARRPDVTWWPELPSHVDLTEVPPGRGLAVGLADLPEEQRRAPVRWEPADGPLLVLGGARSGRSTTLRTLGTQALHAGYAVHAIGLPAPHVAALRAAGADRLGTVVPLDDPSRAARLLARLVSRAPGPPADGGDLVLVDGLDVLADRLAPLGRGEGTDLLARFCRERRTGVHLAATGPASPALLRLLGDVPHRLVLPTSDPTLDALAGVPGALAGTRTAPGRAVALLPGTTAACQVATAPVTAAPVTAAPVATPGSRSRPRTTPLRIGPLPERVPLPDARTPPEQAGLLLGHGGDGPAPTVVPVGATLLVAGPPGSGRTGALRALAHAWARRGVPVLRVAPRAEPGPWQDVAPDDLADLGGPALPAGPVRGTTPVGPALPPAGAAPPPVVLVDDADELERTAPGVLDVLAAPRGAARVAAVATTTTHAATAYRGPVAQAVRGRHLLVLDARGSAATDLLGPGAWLLVDPHRSGPGRGVLRLDRALAPVQVCASDT
ncbi:hypothetical protein Col01nite_24710 [Cellulomonas oligotrophica]|uniref:FtsK domain-containing protein n=1 Tax=Cellulomonas oligotrophica TaxID=931536 RepID=A0ABQ4DC63_9CELL|nr:hypothetical protein Col01nite_24710 [Cellulomonas oligotrophica]